ncbi:MAG: citramalate synthase [Syntrophus sp. (in: bacteria)]|nr:citramalate synthase [Syntrophus sp. (in: bacteria)]
MNKTSDVLIYDTTLRDGTQGEQINFSAEEKLRIAMRLDEMGFHYIEGGWPGSNPKDARFFELAKNASFRHARLAAFGSTRKLHSRPQDCPNLQALLNAQTPAVAIFGKTWDFHVIQILETTLEENLAMIRDSVAYLQSQGKEVVYDAEHFFDGYKKNPAYARKTLEAAMTSGADWIVLCDTNGGTLPHEITTIIREVTAFVPVRQMGIHAHNDGGVAVANSLTAVHAGVKMVQGTINGFGERCGNADLIPIMANLQLKLKKRCLSDEALRHLTHLSNYVSDIANVPPLNARPFVGRSAFAHKGGVHVSAVIKNAAAYEHIKPELVGNEQRVLVSDLAGKSNIEYKARQLGVDLGLDKATSKKIVREIKKMEDCGYQFDAAEASLSLLIKKQTGEFVEPFNLESYHVLIAKRGNEPPLSQASIKISVGDEQEVTAAEGNGPVNALDNALRKALTKFYPQIGAMHLVDFKVRIVEGSEGTAALVKVLIDTRDEDEVWSTIGVSENVIEASWHALVDSIQYKLSKAKLNNNHGGKSTDRNEKKMIANLD